VTKFVASVRVPDGLDPAEAQRLLDNAAAERQRKDARLRLQRDALESDGGLRAWLHAKGIQPFAPIVRASTYEKYRSGAGYIDCQQLPDWGYELANDPRRPVLMRGSRYALVERHGWTQGHHSPNGWCAEIADRYFRRIKLTCFDPDEFEKVFRPVSAKLREKYSLSYHFYHYFQFCCGAEARCYFKGRCIWVTRERRERWLRARAVRKMARRVDVPRRISADVAQRALKELGVFASKSQASGVIRQILNQPKETVNA
jgi:hypothetical protein